MLHRRNEVGSNRLRRAALGSRRSPAVASLTGLLLGAMSIVVAVPAAASGGSTGWAQISGGFEHTCALAKDAGAAYCWGANTFGQLGNGGIGNIHATPTAVAVPAGVTGWAQVSAGYGHTCAITAASGAAYCWGDNTLGQLGNDGVGPKQVVPVAVTVPAGVTGWQQISAGASHTCAVAAPSGAAYCWGDNSFGELGNDDPGNDQAVPVAVAVPSGATGWYAISAGAHFTCGIASPSGSLYCWGMGNTGELGDGDDMTDKAVPMAVVAPAGVMGWDQVSAGFAHACAIATSSHATYCWGDNDFGELGNGGVGTDQAVPVAVSVPVGVTGWDQLSAVGSHTCAIATSTGTAYCWGYNAYGQVGNDDRGHDQAVPVAVVVPPGVTGWVHVDLGIAHSCAITTAGAAYCWGYNDAGQLGNDGAGNDQAVPVAVSLIAQSIAFTAPASTPVSAGSVDLSGAVSATSGLAVTIQSTSPAVCTVFGSSVTLVSTGTCALVATQAGDDFFALASPVSRSFTILDDQASAPPTTTSVSSTPPGETLPATGSPAGPVTGLAIGLIGIGAALIAAGRRRARNTT